MRVSNKQMADSVSSNIFKKTEQLLKTQNMISSGKRISKLSDDPIGMGKMLDYRKTISSIEQYSRNITHGKSQLQLTDSTLESINNFITTAKKLAMDNSGATIEEGTQKIVVEQVKNIYDQVLQLANTKLGNGYIFAGHETDTVPFSHEDYNAEYKGDDGEIRLIVGENVDIKINVNGDEVFNDGVNIFNVLRDLKDGVENNDTAKISAQVELLDKARDQINNVRAKGASIFNRLETTENHLTNFKQNVESMLSVTEDTDIAKAIIDLKTQETAYQTSLATAARIIQPSLMDFLR